MRIGPSPFARLEESTRIKRLSACASSPRQDTIRPTARSGRLITKSWCHGLRIIVSLPGLQRRLIVYPDSPRLKTNDGIEVVLFATLAETLVAQEL